MLPTAMPGITKTVQDHDTSLSSTAHEFRSSWAHLCYGRFHQRHHLVMLTEQLSGVSQPKERQLVRLLPVSLPSKTLRQMLTFTQFSQLALLLVASLQCRWRTAAVRDLGAGPYRAQGPSLGI